MKWIGKKTHYRISTYIFVPRSLGSTEESYPKNEFYGDIKNYIRIKTPQMSLRDLIDEMIAEAEKISTRYRLLHTAFNMPYVTKQVFLAQLLVDEYISLYCNRSG